MRLLWGNLFKQTESASQTPLGRSRPPEIIKIDNNVVAGQQPAEEPHHSKTLLVSVVCSDLTLCCFKLQCEPRMPLPSALVSWATSMRLSASGAGETLQDFWRIRTGARAAERRNIMPYLGQPFLCRDMACVLQATEIASSLWFLKAWNPSRN